MKKLIAPISWRKKDRVMAGLLRSGSASDDELFVAQFGEWPVRGLNKDTPRDKVLDFKDYWNNPENRYNFLMYLTTLGYVEDDKAKRELYLNRLLLSPLGHFLGIFSSKLVYARFHDIFELGVDATPASPLYLAASLWSSYRYAMGSSLVQMLAPSLADVVGHEHIHVLQLKDGISKVPTTNFLDAAKDIVEHSDPQRKLATEVKQTLDMVVSMMPREYFSMDHEVQARLHTIMVQGYKSWGQLPQTEEELYAALRDRGIKTPGPWKTWLSAAQQTGLRQKYFRQGRTIRSLFNPASAEINIGLHSHHNTDVFNAYWQKYLPSLYADLLVLYGDSQGHSRMGFEKLSEITNARRHTAHASQLPIAALQPGN